MKCIIPKIFNFSYPIAQPISVNGNKDRITIHIREWLLVQSLNCYWFPTGTDFFVGAKEATSS